MASPDAVLVTGASTGIGQAIVERLASDGHRVFAAVRDLSTVADHPLVTPIRLDVTSDEEARAAAETVRAGLGGSKLRGIVNNAGVAVGGPVEFLELDELRRQLEVNVVGQVAVTQSFLPVLREQGIADPRIVFTSSIAGHVAFPMMAPYAASKFGLIAVAESLRRELRDWGFKVSVISPGNVTTPIWEKGRAAVAEMTQSAPEGAMALYGDYFAALGGVMDEGEGSGVPASKVADRASHALFAKRPKAEYIVGTDAKALLLASRALPTAVFDRMVMREIRRRGSA
jgi:NAD(P)-dependent dehydrogenase (short-subunit alcohol dehydrogenase family)